MKDSSGLRILFMTARGTAWVAGIFCAVVLIFLVASIVQTDATAAPEITGLQELKRRLQADPQDVALMEQVRALDQLARKAYFTSRTFARAGAWLLLGGSLVWVVSLQAVDSLAPRLPRPTDGAGGASPAEEAAVARRGVVFLGVGMLAAAVGLVVYTGGSGTEGEETVAAGAAAAPEEDWALQWPSFRGPGGYGVSASERAPVSWDTETGENIRWTAPVPRLGFNSPVVWGRRVFLSGADDETLEIYAYDADSGELLWRHECVDVPGSPAEWPQVMEDTGYAAPSLVVDGRQVIALFATGDMVACNLDGERLWARNIGVPDNHYGHASSLIQQGDLVYVQYDQVDQARVMAIRVRDGSTAWQQVRDVSASWASPILIEHEGVRSLVLSADPLVVAYDPVSGAPRWSLDCMGGEIAPSPAFGGGKVFAANEYPRLAAIDAAGGTLDWEYEEELPDVPSPLATDLRVYIVSSYGVISCLEIETGTLRWQHELDAEVYSSPVAAAGRIHVLDRDGTMHIFRDADAFALVGTGSIHEMSTCTAAIVDGRIYIRGASHLYCIEDSGGDAAP